jgi:hypothetical protein
MYYHSEIYRAHTVKYEVPILIPDLFSQQGFVTICSFKDESVSAAKEVEVSPLGLR